MEDLRAPAPGTPRPRTRGARRRPPTPTPLSTGSRRHQDAAFPVLPAALPTPRRPVTAAQPPTATTPLIRGGAGVGERREVTNATDAFQPSLGERLHACGLKRSVVQAQLFPAVNGARLSSGLSPRERRDGEGHSDSQSADESSLRHKPLASSLNVNPTGAVLIPRIYQEQKARWETKLQRLMAGVIKLEETNSLVTTLQDELVTLQPVLVSKTKEAEELLAQVAIDQVEAEQVAKRVGADEAVVKEQQQEVAACQADAQRDLDQALPALNAAVAALDSLDKKDIAEVKGFVKPPQAVQVVMESVCIMLGEKADWDNSKRILSRGTFMSELKEYDKDNIPVAILKKIRKYIENPEFAVEEVKKVSHAAMSLCMWVHAIDTYARVFREVAPKRQRLAEMNLVLESANAKLATKQQELSKVLEKVRKLKEKCNATLAEKQRLLEESEVTQQRLQNAEKLTVGLHDERIRWKGSIKLLKQEGSAILGDSFLTAACMSYLGPFDGLYRGRLLQRWAESAITSIGASGSFVLANAYGDIRELREWQLLGLPSDSFSTDNAICVLKSKQRWALMIDPQQQAIQWIKRLEALYHLEIVKSDDSCLMQMVEECLVGGKPLLIEDVTEILDPSLEPVLAVKPSQRSCDNKKPLNRVQVKLEDRLVETDMERFRLYLTTKLANPHFMPDVFIRVNVVNFTVTRDGLEEQLLSDVVLRERMEVEERKHTLLASIARDQQQLQDIEIKILNLLSDAKGNILDDIELIQALETSKKTSNVVAQRLTESEVTKLEVLEIRNQYHSVAVRGAILFFVTADLAESCNILLNHAMEAKVIDFGISRERMDQTMTAGVGTSLWMAPEVMLGEKYDDKADMFSFGVVLSELDTHTK
ncbi:Dynein heavy chain [Phytophthora cinnamomi]|uniref:Dynein heavy chain n=1 Tax=Phytophthora cinnamomi TaxID=4785 RepID=UPI0035595D81|nr:Dynein heavy chain [Phytophthora cinnamomi]